MNLDCKAERMLMMMIETTNSMEKVLGS